MSEYIHKCNQCLVVHNLGLAITSVTIQFSFAAKINSASVGLNFSDWKYLLLYPAFKINFLAQNSHFNLQFLCLFMLKVMVKPTTKQGKCTTALIPQEIQSE